MLAFADFDPLPTLCIQRRIGAPSATLSKKQQLCCPDHDRTLPPDFVKTYVEAALTMRPNRNPLNTTESPPNSQHKTPPHPNTATQKHPKGAGQRPFPRKHAFRCIKYSHTHAQFPQTALFQINSRTSPALQGVSSYSSPLSTPLNFLRARPTGSLRENPSPINTHLSINTATVRRAVTVRHPLDLHAKTAPHFPDILESLIT